jgi:hypothetical protein
MHLKIYRDRTNTFFLAIYKRLKPDKWLQLLEEIGKLEQKNANQVKYLEFKHLLHKQINLSLSEEQMNLLLNCYGS